MLYASTISSSQQVVGYQILGNIFFNKKHRLIVLLTKGNLLFIRLNLLTKNEISSIMVIKLFC